MESGECTIMQQEVISDLRNTSMDKNEAKTRNRRIEKQLKRDFKKESKYIKLLVLGAAESGKSTIIKQMKLIHPHVNGRVEQGFTREERMDARRAIYCNIIDNMNNLVMATETLQIDGYQKFMEKNPFIKTIDIYLKKLSNFTPKKVDDKEIAETSICPTSEVLNAIKGLWDNEVVQIAYKRRNEFQLADSMAYFIQNLERIFGTAYEPNEQDILRARVKTTGVNMIEFTFKKIQFRMFDVGGHRSERKKWIHCFDNVTAILFVVSIAEYDQLLDEDQNVNRMKESMKLFEDIVNNQFFKKKSFICFFNKKDLFERKIREISLKPYFPNYRGDPHSFTESSEFLVEEYFSKNKEEYRDRSLYPHITTATDTKHVKFVFVTAVDILLTQNLRDLNLL